MVKKIIPFLMTFLVLFTGCTTFDNTTKESDSQNQAQQSELPTKHSHSWGIWTITKNATCTEQGEETRECTACGEKETRNLAATGHNWKKWYISKNATCTEQGEETRECDSCEKKQTVPIIELGHDYETPIFLWNKIPDNSANVTATTTCTHNKSHILDIPCAINKDFSYNEDETVIFLVETASVVLDGVTYSSTRYKPIFKWRTLYLTDSNCYDWLHLGFLYSEPDNVEFEVSALYTDVIYKNVSVTFTTDTFGIYYATQTTPASYSHKYDEFNVVLGGYKSEKIKAPFSIRSCTIKSIFVDGSVSYWQEVTENWIYE